METKLVLGLEGGGTKTDWIFLRHQDSNSELIEKGKLPPSNLKLTSATHLKEIFQTLPANVTHVGIYLAGCVTEQDREQLLRLGRQIWPAASIRAGSDRESALTAAFGKENGITVISGTGSAVTGRKNGRMEKAGGRGHLLGDRGGAYVICMEGLRLALRTYDLDHITSPMAQAILRDLSLSHMEELINWVQTADKTAISRLCPVLFASAIDGDEEMMGVIRAGAQTLATYTESVSKWLDFPAPQVRLLGGIFLNQPIYSDLYKKHLALLLPNASASLCQTPGSFGAAMLAVEGDSLQPPKHHVTEMDHNELERATTEQFHPRAKNLESLRTQELVNLIIEEEAVVQSALEARSAELVEGVDLLVAVFQNDGRLFYTGAGTSGRLGVLDASEIPPTFGESPERVQGIIAGGVNALYKSVEGAEDDELQAVLAVQQRGVTSKDVVCGLTASGRTPFVLGSLREARRIGAKTMLITCNPDRKKEEVWDVEIDFPTGPEIVTGSTRMKAGTTTKVALNILTTCSMIRMGRTRNGWMVDLKPSNTKLRHRSIRLVSHLKKISMEEAEELLNSAGWNIRKVLSM